MATHKFGAAMLAGLLYAQCLLGLIAVALVVGKNATGWPDAVDGYGVRPQSVIVALSGQAGRSGIARRE